MSKHKVKKDPIFKIGISVRQELQASFCFETQEQVNQWLKTDFLELQQKYGPLTYSQFNLPGFKVGDTCYVYGDGDDTYKILKVITYSPHRFGFVLDSGCSEEVVKCHDGREYGWTGSVIN